MFTTRPRRWTWAGLACSAAALYQAASCFTLDQVAQVFADQVALTSATFVRSVISAAFGTLGP
jgi:hypothetical protein